MKSLLGPEHHSNAECASLMEEMEEGTLKRPLEGSEEAEQPDKKKAKARTPADIFQTVVGRARRLCQDASSNQSLWVPLENCPLSAKVLKLAGFTDVIEYLHGARDAGLIELKEEEGAVHLRIPQDSLSVLEPGLPIINGSANWPTEEDERPDAKRLKAEPDTEPVKKFAWLINRLREASDEWTSAEKLSIPKTVRRAAGYPSLTSYLAAAEEAGIVELKSSTPHPLVRLISGLPDVSPPLLPTEAKTESLLTPRIRTTTAQSEDVVMTTAEEIAPAWRVQASLASIGASAVKSRTASPLPPTKRSPSPTAWPFERQNGVPAVTAPSPMVSPVASTSQLHPVVPKTVNDLGRIPPFRPLYDVIVSLEGGLQGEWVSQFDVWPNDDLERAITLAGHPPGEKNRFKKYLTKAIEAGLIERGFLTTTTPKLRLRPHWRIKPKPEPDSPTVPEQHSPIDVDGDELSEGEIPASPPRAPDKEGSEPYSPASARAPTSEPAAESSPEPIERFDFDLLVFILLKHGGGHVYIPRTQLAMATIDSMAQLSAGTGSPSHVPFTELLTRGKEKGAIEVDDKLGIRLTPDWRMGEAPKPSPAARAAAVDAKVTAFLAEAQAETASAAAEHVLQDPSPISDYESPPSRAQSAEEALVDAPVTTSAEQTFAQALKELDRPLRELTPISDRVSEASSDRRPLAAELWSEPVDPLLTSALPAIALTLPTSPVKTADGEVAPAVNASWQQMKTRRGFMLNALRQNATRTSCVVDLGSEDST